MSYESVNGFYEDMISAGTPTSEEDANVKLLSEWSGAPKTRSRIATISDVSTYAAAGCKVSLAKFNATKSSKWDLAVKAYFNAFVWSRRPMASVVAGKEMLASADRTAAAAQGGVSPHGPGNIVGKPPIDLSDDAPPVPAQISSGFMGVSPIMMIAAAAMAYIVFFGKKGKGRKGKIGKRGRRKARRAYR